MEVENLHKSLRKWLMLIYGITALVALFIVLSVIIFRQESSNGFEAFLNAIFDAVYQIMVIFFYLIFVFVSSTIGYLYGYIKKLDEVKRQFIPYALLSLICIVILMILSRF